MTHLAEAKAALFDIDGTLTTGGDVWGGLLGAPEVAVWRRAWLYATALPHYGLSKAGLISERGFRERWVRLMAWLMTGWTAQQVQGVYDMVAHDFLVPDLRPDTVVLLNQHKAAGHPVILVSNMFEGIVQALAVHLGADAGLGSRVAMDGDRCLGRIAGQTCAGPGKVTFAQAYLAAHHPALTIEQCAGYADSRSDAPLLGAVGFPVAVYADAQLRAEAEAHGWALYPA